MTRRFRAKPVKNKTKKAIEKVKDKLPTPSKEEESSAPRITNDSVAEHREEVLSGGRRFLYPLQHSKHKVVIISGALIVLLLITAVIMSYLLLYRWQSTSNFAYRVTQIVPVPVARVDGEFVSYEKYLFELNSAIFYYTNHAQEGVDINGPEGDRIIEQSKLQALEKAKLDTIAEKIAKENNINITNEQINAQIEKIQEEGGIGGYTGVLDDVLNDFYGWDINDLRRVVKMQLIKQEIPRLLDTETKDQANNALAELSQGKKFADIAKSSSEDNLTAEKGGKIGEISRDSDRLPSEFIEAAFALEEGQTSSELVETPFGYHIIKVDKKTEETVDVSHILFRFFNVEQFLKEKLESYSSSEYISITSDS